jgi:CubicO group peptidase (beta-lactamase class C family)
MSTPSLSQVQDAITAAAANAVNSGSTIGIAIGAILGNNPPVTACAGVRNYETQLAVATDTIFQIGSITKIFTTGYFGQLVSGGSFSFAQPLSDFSNGAMPGLTANPALENATLQDIATFAVGLPSTPPPKEMGNNPRPTIAEWGVTDFVNWFVGQSPAMKYIYSDICTGILGLLSTNPSPTTSPLPANAVNVWLDAIESNIIQPLSMNDTVVVGLSQLTSSQESRLASGYQQALATAAVNAYGSVSGITVTNPGAGYTSAPAVSIVSVTGNGATATAVLSKNGTISSIQVNDGGSGYSSIPNVLVAPGECTSNNLPVWSAAGGISSTVNDMLSMVQQCLSAYSNPGPAGSLSSGLNLAMQSYGYTKGTSGTEYGMAWEINSSNAGPEIFKPGGLAGFSSYICILPQQNLGFIVFCNTWLGNPKFTPANDTVSSIINSLFGK